MPKAPVQVEGLAQLSRDLKAMERSGESREVNKALKEGAKLVLRTGRPFAARKTGETVGAWRVGMARNTAFVRNREPQAGVLEFGGRIAPRGTPFAIRARPSMTRALQDKEERIIDLVGDAIEVVARKHGW